MKAIRIHEFGGIDKLILEDAPIPTPLPNEILVKIKATAINPLDWKVREGWLPERVTFPCILGWDVAGIVEEVGSKVTRFKKGDAIYAMPNLNRNGTYAEYVVMDESDAALKPSSLNFEEAAAVPLAALTAWQVLNDAAQLTANQKILVHAASGGVGSFIVQFAKVIGAYVVATTSTKNVEEVKALGADEVIDYTKQDVSKRRQEFDCVFDPIGKDVQSRSWECLRKGGVLISIVGISEEDLISAKNLGVRGKLTLVVPSSKQLETIGKLIDQGKVKPFIGSILPLERIKEAHTLSQSGHAKGKIVIRIAN